MRWVVAGFATVFFYLVERFDGWVLGHVMLYVGVFVFTFGVFHALDRWQEQARAEAGRFRDVFEAVGVGIVLVGPDCRIVEVNDAVARLSGWDRTQLTGREICSELLTCPANDPLGCPGLCPHWSAVPRHGEEAGASLELKHQSGTHIPVMISRAPLAHGPGKGGFVLLLWDVTERKRLEAEAAHRRLQAEGLRQIGREIASMPDPKHGMDRILDQARHLFGMDLMAWGLLDEAGQTVTWQAACGTGSPTVRGSIWPLEGTVMGRILMAGRPFITHNLTGTGGPAASLEMQTAMAVPFRVRETAHGVLFCAAARQLPLTDEDVMLFTHLGSHLATAVENGHLLEDLQRIATLEERQRLAREIHDSIGQTLTYMGVRHHFIARLAEQGDTAGIIGEVGSLRQVLEQAHIDVRRSIFHLKDGAPPRSPLVDRWSQLAAEFSSRTGIQVQLDAHGAVPHHLPDQADMQLFRILQEALANIRNHSGAMEVRIGLTVKEHRLEVSIADDGCGFAADEVQGPEQHHFGLSIMRERAMAAGADLAVRSMRGRGTTVLVWLPLTNREG